MSTLEATMSMLEAMPEDARLKVLAFTQQLFTAEKPANPFVPKSADSILHDLEESHSQIARGEGRNMRDALMDLGQQHGFV